MERGGGSPGCTRPDLYREHDRLDVFDPSCSGTGFVGRESGGTIVTNAAGNGRDDLVVRPEDIPGFLVSDAPTE